MKNKLKVLSLFDGMSVAQQALKNIGADVKTYYASEIDEYAMVVTQSNFPDNLQLGGVETLKTEAFTDNLPVGLLLYNEIDLMIGGSPCQDLSIAKKNREGLKGSRSNLFWEYVRILNEVKPKYFVLENVASMSKESKEIISESLGVQPVMINASLVSAQNRKRLFWIGKFNGKKYVQVEVSQPEDKNILLSEVIETVSNEVYTYRRTYFRKNLSGKVPTLTANMGTGGNNIPYVISSRQEHATVSENKSTPLTSAMGMGGGHVPCISLDGENWRKITPVECLRLQSMPDDYFDKAVYKNKPISNTQRYKMCGNAFNCKVIEHILKYIV